MKRLICIFLLIAFPSLGQEIWRPGTTYTMGFDDTSRKVTTAFGAQAKVARIVCTQACYVAFAASNSGSAATAYVAGATSIYVPANVPEEFIVSPNGWVAVIRVTTSGTFSVTELSK